MIFSPGLKVSVKRNMSTKLLISMTLFFCLSYHSIVAENNGIVPDNPLNIFAQLQKEKVEEVIIFLPMDSLMLHKNTAKSFEGKFTYWNQEGKKYSKSIAIKPRGKSRRRHCDFPPLKLSFSKNDLQHHGLRAKHRSLKLVTHCNLTNRSNDNILKEYLTYKIYNELTENSLQVQLLKIKYVDTESNKELEYYGFLLEDIDALAERLGGKELNTYGRMLSDFDSNNVELFTLFQFMIGNDDWQVPQRRNLRYIQLKKQQDLLVPYDFDMTGLVAVAYAKPNINLGLKSVTQRLFMGDFEEVSRRSTATNYFISKRKNMYELINNCEVLSKSGRRHMKNYLMSFFEIIMDPLLVNRALPVGKEVPEMTALDGTM